MALELLNGRKISAGTPVYDFIPAGALVPCHVPGDETPVLSEAAFQSRMNFPEITAHVGGTAAHLDSLATAGRVLNSMIFLCIADKPEVWTLRAYSGATDIVAGWVRGTDWAAGTNERAWMRLQ